METLDFASLLTVGGGITVPGRPCGRLIMYPGRAANYFFRFSLESSGPGGVRSVWDHGAKREEGGGVQTFICTPDVQLGLAMRVSIVRVTLAFLCFAFVSCLFFSSCFAFLSFRFDVFFLFV